MKVLKKEVIKISKSSLFDFAMLLLGATIMALAFNLFFIPNDIVIGFSGLSIVASELWGIKPSYFIAAGYAVLVLLSFIVLGFKSTKRSVIGSILYPLLVEATSYLTIYISFNEVEPILLIILGAVSLGFGSGLVYRFNYSTGGSDIINQIISKFLKRPIGYSMILSNIFIISVGFFTFGINAVIYSLVVAYIMSIVIDKVMIGISESKTFNIITESESEVKKFLLSNLSHGVTVTEGRGGYTGNVIKVIMCVVPTKEYMIVKEGILNIDKNALILVSDVYEVVGNK